MYMFWEQNLDIWKIEASREFSSKKQVWLQIHLPRVLDISTVEFSEEFGSRKS